MDAPRHPHPHANNRVAVDQSWRPSVGYLLMALGLAVGGLSYLLMSLTSSPDVTADGSTAHTASSAASGALSAWPIQATVPTSKVTRPGVTGPSEPERDSDPTPDLSNYVPRGEKPTMNEVIDRLRQAGIHTGLGAFNPPGTRPPMVGLAVPEGYVLPDGYVRHHQATDDGQRIEAILMFAPGRVVYDAANRPIDVPQDRVVTPELAPAGFPIRRITIPAPIESGRSGL